MGRTKKDAQRLFYDEFYAMTLEQQSRALGILNEHHEYVKRQARKKPDPPSPETASGDGAAKGSTT